MTTRPTDQPTTRPHDQPTTRPAERNRRQWTVVSYDIHDDKRRTKVMKTLEGYGRRVQYSVFECELRPADLLKLQQRLRDLINLQQDDVRFYGLCENCVRKITALGQAHIHRHEDSIVV